MKPCRGFDTDSNSVQGAHLLTFDQNTHPFVVFKIESSVVVQRVMQHDGITADLFVEEEFRIDIEHCAHVLLR